MQNLIDQYKANVAEQSVLDEERFGDLLRCYRAGDDGARLEISGSCLWLGLELAQHAVEAGLPLELLDAVQEANVALGDVIQRFEGNTLAELLECAKHSIKTHLEAIDAEGA